MGQLFDVIRRAVADSAFVPDGVMALCVLMLSLIMIRALGLG